MSQPPQFAGPPPRLSPTPGQSGIVMHFQGSSLNYFVPPTFRINGQQVYAGFGERFYPAPPGRYHVDVNMQWLRTFGQAGCDFDVYPAQLTHVFYAPPATQFQKGAIGFSKQKRTGLVVFYSVLAVLLALVIVGVVLIG